MTEGIYLRCDPRTGWSVVVCDTSGVVVREIINPVATMEEAMRRLATTAGNPVLMQVIDPEIAHSGPIGPLHVVGGA